MQEKGWRCWWGYVCVAGQLVPRVGNGKQESGNHLMQQRRKKKNQTHIELLNVEETSIGSLSLDTLQKAQDSAVPKARSTRDLGACNAIGFRPEEFVS